MTREDCFRLKDSYLVLGDLDKPFHLPECECDKCEGWRTRMGRATHAELRDTPPAPPEAMT